MASLASTGAGIRTAAASSSKELRPRYYDSTGTPKALQYSLHPRALFASTAKSPGSPSSFCLKNPSLGLVSTDSARKLQSTWVLSAYSSSDAMEFEGGSTILSLYQLLGIGVDIINDVGLPEIKRAYRQMALPPPGHSTACSDTVKSIPTHQYAEYRILSERVEAMGEDVDRRMHVHELMREAAQGDDGDSVAACEWKLQWESQLEDLARGRLSWKRQSDAQKTWGCSMREKMGSR